MNRRINMFALCGVIVFLLTVILGIINIRDWSGVTIPALLFALWSVIALFGGLIFVETQAEKTAQLFFRVGCSITLLAYACGNYATSFLFIGFFKERSSLFFTIQFILLAAAAVLCLAFHTIAVGNKQKNRMVLSARLQIEDYVNRLNLLKAGASQETHAAVLGELAEQLRFTDMSTMVPVDSEIERTISGLQMELTKHRENQAKEKIDLLCKHLGTLISQRTFDVSAKKRGGL